MNRTSRRFLTALKKSLLGEEVSWKENISEEEWVDLFRISEKHHVLPMIYEAVYNCPAAGQADQGLFMAFRQRITRSVMLQTLQTCEFVRLYRYLIENGLEPLVVKGIVCRSLYPKPDYRMSGDEDVLIPEEQFGDCHDAMLKFGMQPAEPEKDIQTAYEVPYGKPGSPIYIELHKHLFSPQSDAYGDFNYFFEEVWDRRVEINIDGNVIRSLGHTDHLLYLICHAFKHFLHSGFGIRQVCDIILYANSYGSEIDWLYVLSRCRQIHGEIFAAALFRIGRNYLTFDEKKACYPLEWQEIAVDEGLLLMDLLDSGVYGGATMSRKHSSNMTLSAVAAQKQGRKNTGSVLKSVFPSAKSLEGRFTYLQKYPWLLPAAWVSRILKYREEVRMTSDNDAASAVQIGSQRIELLKEYKILK